MNIVDETTDDKVRKLARPADIRAGHQIAEKGQANPSTFRPDEHIDVTVKMPGASTRHASFTVQKNALHWHCSCTSRATFCKHLVAAALAVQKEGRGDIYKAAGIIIKNGALLVERSVGKPAFIAPGGRIEPGETAQQALVRELKEEFGIIVDAAHLEPFGTFRASAANHPGQQVHMDVFMVSKWQGAITPSAEVEEIRWLTSAVPGDIAVGSIFAQEVIPRLKAQGYID